MELLERSVRWLEAHPDILGAMFVVAVATSIGSVVAVPLIIARLPADYFCHRRRVPGARHPVVRLLKNGIGLVLVLAGVAMLLLPGQGLLTLLAGLVLVEFPGKRRLERRFVRHKAVRRALNWVRAKAGREPLVVDADPDG